jgi:hypothetical protein
MGELVDFSCVDVHTQNVVAELCHAGGMDGTQISGANDSDAHS